MANDSTSLETLFMLRNFHPEVAKIAKETIDNICTNSTYFWRSLYMHSEQPLVNFGKFEWPMMFGDPDINKISYTLEIIESFLTMDTSVMQAGTPECDLRNTWVTRFIQQGGF